MVSPLQTLDPPRYNGRAADPPAPVDATGLRPRRSVGRFLLALLLVAVVVLVFVTVALRADNKQPVLAVGQPGAAGQRPNSAHPVGVRGAVGTGMAGGPPAHLGHIGRPTPGGPPGAR